MTPSPTSPRLLSLDVYRGIVMFCLFAGGFGLAQVAKDYPDSSAMQWLAFNTTHPQWSSQFEVIGFSLWDMIQPAFMFMVGVSMPYSYAKRQQLGDSYGKRLGHAWGRAVVLVLLGVLLQSMRKPETNWLFTNVLSQIGLGYGFLFFLVGKKFRVQLFVGATILVAYWAAMITFPSGLAGGWKTHFEDGSSFPQRFDLWFLNLFPRADEFTGHAYSTLNFVPAMVTMLMGLSCGQLLKDDTLSERAKLRRLILGGAICLTLGVATSPVCPIVKKLWTPSWTLFSGAYVMGLLALLYWLIDVKGWRWGWTFFFVVVGTNSIAAYFMGQLMKPWARSLLETHLPDAWFSGTWGPFWQSTLVAMLFWAILAWMYRNRIFIRI